jgi:membrane protease YdiL (CAAX protease family)
MQASSSRGEPLNLTTADKTAQRPGAAREGLLIRHPLIFYFLIAYALSWLAWVPLLLSKDGAGLLSYPAPIGFYTTLAIASFGPFLSALFMTGVTEGRMGIGRLLRRIVLWRVGLRWYLFALLGTPAILVLTVMVLPGALASFQGLASLAPLPFLGLFIYVFFLGGPFGEETGWRGFALPSLQRTHGPLVGSLILGLIWALWHLPIFWVPAWNLPPTILNIVMFVIAAIAFTIVMTWVFNNTKGSLLIATLIHASFDMFMATLNRLFPAPIVNDYGSNVPVLIGFGALALLLVALTRGRLDYQKHPQEVEPDPVTTPT